MESKALLSQNTTALLSLDSPADKAARRTPVTRRKTTTATTPAVRDALPVARLGDCQRGWLNEARYRQLSDKTVASRQLILEKLAWWCDREQETVLDRAALKRFLTYVATAHTEPGGRWGNGRSLQTPRPATMATYHMILRTFFRWLVQETLLDQSPMESIPIGKTPKDQIQPLSGDQIEALLAAAQNSLSPVRDTAIILFLLDTGIRADEAVSLRMRDVNLMEGYAIIQHGKGNKRRRVELGVRARRALSSYLKSGREPEQSVFLAAGGRMSGEALSRMGLTQLIQRLGQAAKISGVRCSPHTFRHTFAVEFVRGGGNLYALMELLGHTSLTISKRYVAFAEADTAHQHRKASPVERLLGKGRK